TNLSASNWKCFSGVFHFSSGTIGEAVSAVAAFTAAWPIDRPRAAAAAMKDNLVFMVSGLLVGLRQPKPRARPARRSCAVLEGRARRTDGSPHCRKRRLGAPPASIAAAEPRRERGRALWQNSHPPRRGRTVLYRSCFFCCGTVS